MIFFSSFDPRKKDDRYAMKKNQSYSIPRNPMLILFFDAQVLDDDCVPAKIPSEVDTSKT